MEVVGWVVGTFFACRWPAGGNLILMPLQVTYNGYTIVISITESLAKV